MNIYIVTEQDNELLEEFISRVNKIANELGGDVVDIQIIAKIMNTIWCHEAIIKYHTKIDKLDAILDK